MPCRFLPLLAMAMLIGLTACAIPDIGVVRPEPRPLGKDLPTFEPPNEPIRASSPVLPIEEPAGVLTLQQALALAL